MSDLPKVMFEWEVRSEGTAPMPLDAWTLAEVEPLLDRDHDEYDEAIDALKDEIPGGLAFAEDVDVDFSVEKVRAYVEARRSAGLTDRIDSGPDTAHLSRVVLAEMDAAEAAQDQQGAATDEMPQWIDPESLPIQGGGVMGRPRPTAQEGRDV